MPRWIGFLRAVNVGARKLPSAQLREVCAGLGLVEIRTHLQSGNVSFDAPTGETGEALARRLSAALEQAAGFDVPAMVRDVAQLRATLDTAPFAEVEVTEETRLLVLLLDAPLPAEPPLPFVGPKDDVRVISATPGEAFAVALHGKHVPNTSAIVERAFGVRVTGRFEHTLHRILDAAR